MHLEEEFYRQSRFREKRGLAEEMAKFSLCFALSEHDRAFGHQGSHRSISGMDIVGIKAGILGERIRPGDEVQGEALASAFSAVYQPRAYYPSYFLGEMRAALRRGDSAPSASPHYLPVSVMPALPDGWGITFLYPVDKAAFERPDFPAHARDVLTRDFTRIPMLVPPGEEPVSGRLRFQARVLQLNRGTMMRLAGLGEKSYQAYSARGLTHFLQPLGVKVEQTAFLRGSIFAEISFLENPGWNKVMGVLEEAVRGTVEEVFPQCTRGERQGLECYLPHSGFHTVQFRKRLFALVFDPVIVIHRAPQLLGLYLPCDLAEDMGKTHDRFQRFVQLLSAAMQGVLNLSNPPRVDIAYDNRLSWFRDREALRGPAFISVEERCPFLKPTLAWLRGD